MDLNTGNPNETALSPSTLWHYTSWASLKGILEKNELWSSNAAYLNDTGEISKGLSFAGPRIEQCGLSELQHYWRMREPEKLVQLAYVSSFSAAKGGDDLNQWRGYTTSESRFAIGFDLELLTSIATSYGCFLVRCLYLEHEQRQAIASIIEGVQNWAAFQHSRELPTHAPEHHRQRSIMQKTMGASWDLVKAICQIKDESFIGEQEYRIVRQLSLTDKCDDFFTRGRLIVPYVKLPLHLKNATPTDRHPIREIVIGPGPADEQKLNEASVRQLVAKFPHNNMEVQVRRSCVPYRSS